MKNITTGLKDKFVAKYLEKNSSKKQVKSTDINVLLNRVKINQKMNLEKNYISLRLLLQACFCLV